MLRSFSVSLTVFEIIKQNLSLWTLAYTIANTNPVVCSNVEKFRSLPVQLVSELLALYGNRKFISIFTNPRLSMSLQILIHAVAFHFHFTFPYTHRSSNWYHTLRFTDWNFGCISHFQHACYMSCLSHSKWFNRRCTWWRVRSRNFIILSFFSSAVSDKYRIICSTSFSDTLNCALLADG